LLNFLETYNNAFPNERFLRGIILIIDYVQKLIIKRNQFILYENETELTGFQIILLKVLLFS
jgi:hypothetical protein